MATPRKIKVKAWAVFDKVENKLVRFYASYGGYMIDTRMVPQRHLHKTFECIPVEILYSIPKK